MYNDVPGAVGIHSASNSTSSDNAFNTTSMSTFAMQSLSALLFILMKLSLGRNIVIFPSNVLYAFKPSKMPWP